MVLEIWAHGTKENSSNVLMNKNRRNVDLFNPNVETIPVNIRENESNTEHVEDLRVACNTEFPRQAEKNVNVSHLSSNGYYGYCTPTTIDRAKLNNYMGADAVMEYESCNITEQIERKKRGFSDEIVVQNDHKRFKHDDLFDNFRQVSFDPNATSIVFTHIADNKNGSEQNNFLKMYTEIMQTNDSEMSLSKKSVDQTNPLKQKSNDSLRETQKYYNNLSKFCECKRNISYSIYNRNKSRCREMNDPENVLENLFMLTHGGSNYQIWQHYNVNIDT